ncbi:CP2 transcription factor-domain-containing protein [Chlamydoabsidia padenii]|nr:CP2 transcription factor-domain-containing protein [Chlamydoabsidia padenii]
MITSSFNLDPLTWNQHQDRQTLGWCGQRMVDDVTFTLPSTGYDQCQQQSRPRNSSSSSSNTSSTASSPTWHFTSANPMTSHHETMSVRPPPPFYQHPYQHYYSGTSSDSFSTGSSLVSVTRDEPTISYQHQKRKSRFHAILKAPTAITPKSTNQQSSLTYLNRDQLYAIQLADPKEHDGFIRTELCLSFHEPAHRRLALAYWKSWFGHTKKSHLTRTVDIGIRNIRYPSFDRIVFDWHGRHDATVFVRFHCLSTDFSKIKGVKGIPLRICLSYHPLMNDTSLNYHLEQNYCKIKLFRDKGAERKYKDDAKQLKKQMQKINHVGDSNTHPLWLMYRPSVSYTVFDETPSFDITDQNMVPPNQKHSQRHSRQCQPYYTNKRSTTTFVPTQLYYAHSPEASPYASPCRLSSINSNFNWNAL